MTIKMFAMLLFIATACTCLFAASTRAEDDTGVKSTVLVTLAPARPVTMTQSITAYGTVGVSPEHTQELTLQGEVVVERVFVTAGEQVQKGAPLVSVRATANASLEVDSARIAVSYARKEIDRLTGLLSRNLATNAQVQTAKQNLESAEAALANARRRNVGDDGLTLRSGMKGFVDAVNVKEGQVAAPGTALLRLADPNRLRVGLGVEVEDLERIRRGQHVKISPLFPGATPVQGAIQKVYRKVDPNTHLAEAVVPLQSAPGVLPGAMVRGEILIKSTNSVLAVPRSSVLYKNGMAYVFVADKDKARLRRVDAGEDNGEFVEVRKGLSAGDMVITSGNYELSDGMSIRREGIK